MVTNAIDQDLSRFKHKIKLKERNISLVGLDDLKMIAVSY